MSSTDAFLERMAIIGGINLVKIARNTGVSDVSAFRPLIQSASRLVGETRDIERIRNYYLVWYRRNRDNMDGWQFPGSFNYKLSDYKELIQRSKVDSLIASMRGGLTSNVEITTAYDTSLRKGLIVDGTKRALSLFYLKREEPDIFASVLKSRYSIRMLECRSKYCKALFPCDFMKLCQ